MKFSEKQKIKRLKEVENQKLQIQLLAKKAKQAHKENMKKVLSDRKFKRLKSQLDAIEKIEPVNEWMSNHLDNL